MRKQYCRQGRAFGLHRALTVDHGVVRLPVELEIADLAVPDEVELVPGRVRHLAAVGGTVILLHPPIP